MPSLINKIKKHPLLKGEFLFIAWVCVFLVVLGLMSSFIVFLFTFFEIHAYESRFCLSSSCVGSFVDDFKYVFVILKFTGASLAGAFTLGTLGVAASSYVSNKKAFATSNHISHLSIFKSYVESEVSKRSLLSENSFDVVKWYNLIFGESSRGVFSVSEDYFLFMGRLNSEINYSNGLKERKSDGGFRYTEHQGRMIELLQCAGINLNRLSRIDFHNVEGQVLDLINNINSSYCMIDMSKHSLIERLYE